MVCLTSIESVPELYKTDTITNIQLCGSIELLIAMKMQGPWGAIAWKGNKSNAKEVTAEQSIVTKKMMFN